MCIKTSPFTFIVRNGIMLKHFFKTLPCQPLFNFLYMSHTHSNYSYSYSYIIRSKYENSSAAKCPPFELYHFYHDSAILRHYWCPDPNICQRGWIFPAHESCLFDRIHASMSLAICVMRRNNPVSAEGNVRGYGAGKRAKAGTGGAVTRPTKNSIKYSIKYCISGFGLRSCLPWQFH